MKIFVLFLFVTYGTMICLEFWIKNQMLIPIFELRPTFSRKLQKFVKSSTIGKIEDLHTALYF